MVAAMDIGIISLDNGRKAAAFVPHFTILRTCYILFYSILNRKLLVTTK
jgi:hypothetical protein